MPENKIIMIVDWDEHFEKAQTRKKITKHSWVPLPNKHDGLGLKRMLREENGLEIFAIWVLLIQVASKCEIRGTLADKNGEGYSCDDIALKVGCKTDAVERAIPFLVSINWVSVSIGSVLPPRYHRTGSEVCLHNITEQNTTEQNITKQDITEPFFPDGDSSCDNSIIEFARNYRHITIVQNVMKSIPARKLKSPIKAARAIIAAINRTGAISEQECTIAGTALSDRFKMYYDSHEGKNGFHKDPDKWLDEDCHLADSSVWDSRIETKKQTAREKLGDKINEV
jgi:hypothetical protein